MRSIDKALLIRAAAMCGLATLAACGGGGFTATDQPAAHEEAPAKVPDPCTLLTDDEAGAVVGTPATSGGSERLLGSDGLSCVHSGPAPTDYGPAPRVTVRVEAGHEAYQTGRELGTGSFAEEGDTEDVEGLGEEAYVGLGSNGPVKIAWFQSGLALTIEIVDVGAKEPPTVADYESLAHKVEARIG